MKRYLLGSPFWVVVTAFSHGEGVMDRGSNWKEKRKD